jgi:pimeloyl-ACP methyl ester carboxylesterase
VKRTVDVGVPLVVREWPADGAPVVYWGGLNARAPVELDEIAPRWAREHGLRVLAVSPPGLGETPAVDVEGFRPSELARLVVRLLDAVGLGRVAFVGYSWGGFVGCRTAAVAPARLAALALLDAGHADVGPAGTLAEWIEVARGIEPPLPDVEAAGAAMWGLAREPTSETWPALARLAAPILLAAAGDAAGRFARAVPRAQVRAQPAAHAELLAEASALVGAWLAQQGALR